MPLDLGRPPAAVSAAHLNAAETDCWSPPGVRLDQPLSPLKRIGIIGAGTMGGGIAMNFANAGLPVTVVDVSQAAIDRGLAVIGRNYAGSVARGRFSAEVAEARVNLIHGSLAMDDLADCDLIIEAAYEDLELKRSLFERIDAIAKVDAVLATNTSYLDVNEIARATRRPEAVLGMHFFSPANVMRLLEIVRGAATCDRVIAMSLNVARLIGKIPVVVGVGPGFVGNRMLFQREIQAQRLLLEGAMPWEVDGALRTFGFRMGQFEMADLAGLDIGWNAESSRGASIRDLLCETGRQGQKTGAGFYDYDDKRVARPSPAAAEIIRGFAGRTGLPQAEVSEETILQRLLFPMVNEAAAILAEGRASRASDIDVVWIHGYRWPAETGGPMLWADTVGLNRIIAALEAMPPTPGVRLEPHALLKDLAASGGRLAQFVAET